MMRGRNFAIFERHFLNKCLYQNGLQKAALKMINSYEKSVDIEGLIVLKALP